MKQFTVQPKSKILAYAISSDLEDLIVEEYELTKIDPNYWRTRTGRAYIERINNEYRVFAANGNYVTFSKSFRLAAMRANQI